jgi:predicted lysophospholipase L1 biosynthesis ABC-type transport system permease subunit
MTAVRSVGEELQAIVGGQAREWLAADVSVESSGTEFPDAPNGAQATLVTETVSMAQSDEAANPLMVSIKAVDPGKYPFYGSVTLNPPTTLAPGSAVVSRDVMARLHVGIGDRIRISQASYRIAALLISEPDRFISSHNNYPRIVLTHAGLARSGVLGLGNRALRRMLYKLPPGMDAKAVRLGMEEQFPSAEVQDYHDPDPRAAQLIDAAVRFLQAAGLLSVLLGAAGAAIVIFLQVRHSQRDIAVMKCLGARRGRIAAIRIWHTSFVCGAGIVAGLAAGAALQKAASDIAARYFPVALAFHWSWRLALEDTLIAVGAVMLAAMAPVLAATAVRPLILIRRSAPAPGSRRFAFAGAGTLRYGLRNVGRRGLYSEAVVLAVGAMAAAAVFAQAGESSVARELLASLPVPKSILYFVSLTGEELGALRKSFGDLEVLPVARIRLLSIGGAPVARRVFHTWTATCNASVPESSVLLSGINAEQLGGLSRGSELAFAALAGQIRVRVGQVREIDAIENFRYGLVFSCRDLGKVPLAYTAGIRVAPGSEDRVAAQIAAAFPNLPLTSRRELNAAVEDGVHRALWSVRLLAFMMLLSGNVMVAAVISASKGMRLRELAILKTLGARPFDAQTAICVEFAVLGLLAGLLGALGGAAMASVVLSHSLHKRVFAFAFAPLALDVLWTGALAAAAAGLSSRRMVLMRPLDIFRSTE